MEVINMARVSTYINLNYVFARYAKGETFFEIAKDLPIGARQLTSRMSEAGYTLRPPGPKKIIVNTNDIVGALNHGMSVAKIAKRQGVSEATINRHLVKIGVTRKPGVSPYFVPNLASLVDRKLGQRM
jgi:uncharacterized protein (DUF433 family)